MLVYANRNYHRNCLSDFWSLQFKMSLFDELKPLMPTNIVKIIKKYYTDKSDKKVDLASGGK